MFLRLSATAFAASCLCAVAPSAAASTIAVDAGVSYSIIPGERIGEHLLRHGLHNTDETALHWLSPSEQLGQA